MTLLRGIGLCSLLLFLPQPARAHVGSPDVFYDGMVGPWPARIVIRMPGVVPGRAEINVRVQANEPVQVSFLPLYARTAITNAPPADVGRLVVGETNLYSGELWLMSFGAYSIHVRVQGASGDGSVLLPVNSVATRQLPLPSFLGKLLLALGAVLFLGGAGIVAAAARDSGLAPGTLPDPKRRRNGWVAGVVTALIFVAALIGGKKWWRFEETDFRRHLREGAWPDLAATIRAEGSQRILRLTLGNKIFPPNYRLHLLPDHGKVLHLFLVREPGWDAFAHVHPVRAGGKTFDVALPPLPEGTYKLFCDLTFEESGLSSTATNSVHVPAATSTSEPATLTPDPDDSWAQLQSKTAIVPAGTNASFHLPGGENITWHAADPLHAKQDARLQFEVTDPTGQPLSLEPYMGMLSHAAVLRDDGSVFAHLHPSGNFSMAAQDFFESSLQTANLAGTATNDQPEANGAIDHSKMDHSRHHPHAPANSVVALPYEFPFPGNYRVWVQFKTDGRVLTGAFEARVLP